MRERHQILFFVFLSLLLHLLLFGLGSFTRYVKPKPPEEVEVKILTGSPYQIADIQPPLKEEKPKEAKFLGMYDSSVEKEQVSAKPFHPTPQEEGGKGTGPKLASKMPERKTLPGGGQGTDLFEPLPEDFYPDYKVGDRTYLNVLRFPKISYFVRLKKIFKTTFNPVPAIRSYYFTNQISRGQVEVVLGVSVDRTGKLSELFVINSSGLELYDREAIRTIRDSAPFAVPPTDLLDPSDHLRMVWTFTVYM